MKCPARAVLTIGVAVLTGGALVFTPTGIPEAIRTFEVVRPVTLAAGIAPIAQGGPVEPFPVSEVNAALAMIEQLAPVTGHATISVRLGNHELAGPATPTVPAGRAVDAAADAPAVPIAIAAAHPARADDSSPSPAANAALERSGDS